MALDAQSPEILRFGAFEVDVRSGELRKQGKRIKLQDQPFQVLAILLQRPGGVVTREELRSQIWPADTFVDFDNSLNGSINKLREALGDSADSPRFIETLPRRGYRFLAPVSGQPERSKVRVWLYMTVLLAVFAAVFFVARFPDRIWRASTAPRIESVAVLPLDNLSGDPNQEYFADGMTDALITDLAKIGALRVVSRTSVMRYKRTQKSAPEIAKELNVDAIIEGSVARTGNRVRITAQLIRGATDQHLWAESYDREINDLLRAQEEIARSIARGIQVKVTPQEQALLTTGRLVDPEAYELYLKGRYFYAMSAKEPVEKAMGLFEQAIARDPSYASPYSGLADCYTVLGVSFGAASLLPTQAASKARAAAQKAILLDNSLAEGHNSLANIRLLFDWDWAGSEAEFKRALELNPGYSDAHHYYAHLLVAEGRLDQALAESKRALDLDQLSRATNLHLGWHYIYSRQYDLAIEQLRKTLELDPAYGYAYWYMGRAYEQQSKYPEALQAFRKAQELLKGNTAVAADIGHILALSGDIAGARKVLKQLDVLPKGTYVSPVEIALIYLALRNETETFRWLEKAYAERSDLLVYLKVEPRLDSIRSDPRFLDLLRRIGFPPE